MKKTTVVLVVLVLVALVAAVLIAQAPDEPTLPSGGHQGISEDDPRWLKLNRTIALAEAARKIPRVEIDPFEARQALREVVETADDGDIVAFYKVVDRIAGERAQFKAAIQAVEDVLDDIKGRDGQPPVR